jgi:hypothetical protein
MVEQLIIAITGILAVWCSQDSKRHIQKYACLFGIAGQPFWFYSSFQADQWGIFTLSIFYTIAWLKGIYIFWIKAK